MPGPIIGVDEVGLGAWAGPLLVCAYAAPDEEWTLEHLDDSKKLGQGKKKKLRAHLAQILRRQTDLFELVWGPVEDINTHGMARTHRRAMELAIERLIKRVGVPWRVIVDGLKKPVLGAECYPRADGTYPAVMAASIIAKVSRDDYMVQQALQFPQYGFESNMGYGGDETHHHRQALQEHGLCPLHRRTFSPMNAILALTKQD